MRARSRSGYQAVEFLFQARARFRTPLDLGMNASFLSLVALEGLRVEGQGWRTRFAASLAMLWPVACRSISDVPATVQNNPSFAYTLDLVVRALAYGKHVPAGIDEGACMRCLERPDECTTWLGPDAGHPVKLVARHAGGCMQHAGQGDDARRCAEMSRMATRNQGEALKRTQAFTDHVLSGGVPTGPAGSLLNPTYECR